MNHPIIVAFEPWVIGYLLKVFQESTEWIPVQLPRSFDSILNAEKWGRLDAGESLCRFLVEIVSL